MMTMKLFTEWRKSYGIFLLVTLLVTSTIALVEHRHDSLDMMDIFGLAIVVVIFHFFFIGIRYAAENDSKRALESQTLSLDEFAEKYEITEEKALQLLKEGKLKGTISFYTYPLRDKTKEEIQDMD